MADSPEKPLTDSGPAQLTSASQQAQQTPAPPSQDPASSVSSAPATTPSSVAGTTSASQTPAPSTGPGTAPAATQEYEDFRSALRNYGMDLTGQFDNDHAAMQHLVLQARRAGQLEQQIMPHWNEFQRWQSKQAEEKAQKDAAAKQWWKAPEWNPAWRALVQRDPQTGQLTAAPGAPAGIVEKYHEAQNHMQSFLEKFSMDPIQAIRPGIEELIRAEAQKLIQQEMGGYQDKNAITQFIQENSGWLHEKDQAGNPVLDPMTRQPVLSVWGREFARHVQEGEQMGMNLEAQRKYALANVQRDFALAQMKQAQSPAAANQAAKDAFIQQAAGGQQKPQAGGSIPSSGTVPGTHPGQNGKLPLKDRLAKSFQENGFQLSQNLEVGRQP